MVKQFRSKIQDVLISRNYTLNEFRFNSLTDEIVRFEFKSQPKLFFEHVESPSTFYSFTWKYSVFEKTYPVNGHDRDKGFGDLINAFNMWIDELDKWKDEYEQDTPEQAVYKQLIGASIDFSSDEKFEEDEKKALKADIDSTFDFIKSELELGNDRLSKIEAALSELKNLVESMSKFSWKSAARDLMKDVIIDVAKDWTSFTKLKTIFSSILENSEGLLNL